MEKRLRKISRTGGQSLIEVVIGITIGTLILGTAAGAVLLTLRIGAQSKSLQVASALAQALLDNVTAVSQGNWHGIYNLSPKGPSAQYYLVASGGSLSPDGGSEEVTVDGAIYTRYFTIENVGRDDAGDILDGGADDPSTQKITAIVQWQQVGGVVDARVVKYLTRSRNQVFRQSDWSGGSGQTEPVVDTNNKFEISENINFAGTPGSIKIQGY